MWPEIAAICFPIQIMQKSSKFTLSAMGPMSENEKVSREAKSKLVVMGIEGEVKE